MVGGGGGMADGGVGSAVRSGGFVISGGVTVLGVGYKGFGCVEVRWVYRRSVYDIDRR